MTRPARGLPLKALTVAGIMSGTSADGIDVAIVRIDPGRIDPGRNGPGRSGIKLRLIGHAEFPFAPALRKAVLSAMNATSTSTAELARLNWRLGQAYAEALTGAMERFPARVQLVGCHGQTIYHQAAPQMYAGRPVACTWQIGEPAMLAAAARVPVVSNFRPADMVAGGQGAPLVPLLDATFFRHPTRTRVLQNIGGIGNLAVVPAGTDLAGVLAFDTGPGNMVIDRLMRELFGKDFDRGGKTAAGGRVLDRVVDDALRAPFFRRQPPKSAGREQFGEDFSLQFLSACREAGGGPEDCIASATALTARSIRLAHERFVRPVVGNTVVDFIISGGGSRNPTLLNMLTQELRPLGAVIKVSDKLGLPSQAKEAAAFALLAYYTWHQRAGNVPSATGATRPAILGSITYA